jgi:hypothetical protein
VREALFGFRISRVVWADPPGRFRCKSEPCYEVTTTVRMPQGNQ